MKFNFQNNIALAIVVMTAQVTLAQKRDANIGSEEVTVTKSYSPTISDANKIKEVPSLDDDGNAKKETIKYAIFSFPVASTFAPLKGKAEGVDKTEQAKLYDNYATLGLGNFGTLNAELFVNKELNSNDYIGGMFRHLSSQGGIKNADLNTSFYDTAIDLNYGANYDEMTMNFDLGYKNQSYNWYGLPTDLGNTLTSNDRANLINSIEPQHSFNTISLGGRFAFDDSLLNKADLKFIHFSDSFSSNENRFVAEPTFQFDVKDELVKTKVVVDYVGGSFENNYLKTNTETIKYGYTNIGIQPSFVMLKDDWTLNLGAGLFYSMDSQNNKGTVYVYPQVTASLKVVGDLMIFYAGAEGSLDQNSYQQFVGGNPFLSPTMGDKTSAGYIKPTDKQYDISAGLKGKLANNVSYNLRASYLNEKNKALYKSQDYNETIASEAYAHGNSFQVVYDDVKTLSFSGNVKANFSENVTFGLTGTFNSFATDTQQEAWNLPTVKIESNLDVAITQKWFAGTQLFYVGKRMDIQQNTALFLPNPTVELGSYFDLNAHVGYKHSDRLTGFLKGNNITNNGYQKWLNYPVQGFQIVLGANYKFEF
ncbi:TonB-dependent receptor [Flavobacterium faecale]|uniref:TonB-dependent receptor n=1 Tax=Flavobacterium faecale TaxID=1355330 RepID=A0A2S1LEC3_9FLAO|nr:TonB-dependent receptor [Flavobacterium faecale]AWG22095.1 TonB-dependent receptor [Flavobacterium faecale]